MNALDTTSVSLLRRAAYHEAGHVVAARAVGAAVCSVDLQPTIKRLACTNMARLPRSNAEDIRDGLLVLAAGAVAERIFDPSCDAQVQGGDSSECVALAQALYGLAEPNLELIQAEIEAAEHRAERLLRLHWPRLKRLAEAFVEVQLAARFLREVNGVADSSPVSDPQFTVAAMDHAAVAQSQRRKQ